MPIEILMPALSPTMTEGNLAKWLKKEGDKVNPGDVIAEIETDKATMEVEAVDEGIIGKILVNEGTENVLVNNVIAILLEEGETEEDLKNYKINQIPSVKEKIEEKLENKNENLANKEINNKQITNNGTRIFASPLAKRIASNEGIDLTNINGTGPHGRIIKADVLNAANNKEQNTTINLGRNTNEITKIPLNNMRKVIAKRLLESKQTVPHFYLSIDCCLDKLLVARSEMNNAVNQDNPQYKLSVNDFMIKAVAMALRDVPDANASWTDEAILKYNNIDISVAVAIDGGLITPIIKNADQKTLSQISNEMKDLVKRAKSNSLKPEEFQGGGFSISNLGMYGIKKFEAIINPPQSCILAIGAGEKRAIVKDNQIIAANMVDISLSCDHRVVDGAVGANFLNSFRKYIENPILMFV